VIVALWSPDWGGALEGVAECLIQEAPRLALGSEVIWADARGLDAGALGLRLRRAAERITAEVRAGVAQAAIVAEVAARTSTPEQSIQLAPTDERAYLAPLSLTVLQIDESLRVLLHGVGVETCGELAALEREAIEVRFGPEVLRLWQWSRGTDERRLFTVVPAEPVRASIDFIDYVITDPERLIFSANAMFGGICEGLQSQGQHARRVKLTLSLANGELWERVLRPARPTASRTVWLRLARALLERITVSDAVTGIALVVDGIELATSIQGDLFDAGFATASAVDAAIARLVEAQGDVIAEIDESQHPQAEQRSTWKHNGGELATRRVEESRSNAPSGLTLQLLPDPREVLVETIRRRDHNVPVRYRDGQWKQLVTAAGPDRISGGHWETQPYAREYYRAVTVDGLLVWLYRDAKTDQWYLHGWWD
jgi:protein ImuB